MVALIHLSLLLTMCRPVSPGCMVVTWTVTVGASVIQPAAAVRDLGLQIDQELSMTQHIAKVTSSCFYQLCRTGTRRSAGALVRSFEA